MPENYVFSALDWATQVVNPPELMRRALAEERECGLLSLFRNYWAFPIFVSFALNSILFALYGINVTANELFIALYLFVVTLKTLIDAVILYGVLWIFDAQPVFGVVCACYTAFVVFSPILGAAEMPSTYHVYFLIKSIKEQHLDVWNSWLWFRHNLQHLQSPLNDTDAKVFDFVGLPLGYAAYFLYPIATVFVAEGLSQTLGSGKLRTYAAVCVTTWFALIPEGIFLLVKILIGFAIIP